jgi:transcriptional regulator NrdR family protein
MTGYESKKAAAQDKLAQPAQEPIAARPCRNCDGTGERYTGIDEAPTSICIPCKGTGQIALEREALKLALEVLENLPGYRADIDNAITAIKEALAQQAQRPWVGLTDEVQAALWDASRAALPRFHTYATLIEKELKILNT